MDKIDKYSHIVTEFLQEYGSIKRRLAPAVQNQILIDKENHHYQLLVMGWHKNEFTYFAPFHFDIINGKIWIQQNNTEVMVADELIERGVDKADIVLGFLSEETRQYSGFAVS